MRTIEEFWAAVDVRGPDECWHWKLSFAGRGWKEGKGYGQVNWQGTHLYSHRLAFTLGNGLLDPEKQVRHTCDNPPCCNPRHLVEGTAQQNSDDMMERKRWRHEKSRAGADNGNARLTDAQVAEIRAIGSKVSQRKLAERYGVGKSQIGNILRGEQRKK